MDGFSSPPSADQTSAKARSSGGGRATVTGTGQPQLGQRPGDQVLGQRVEAQEGGEQRRQQPVLVLGTLGPGGHQVGELEVPRRQVPGHDPPLVRVVLVDHAAVPPAHVLADVVEVDVDGGGVAAAGPLPGGRVEHHLDVAAPDRLALDQSAQGGVDLADHGPQSAARSVRSAAGSVPSGGHGGLPFRAGPRGACRSYAEAVTDPVIRLDSDRVAVEPGGQAQVGVTISNPGSIVEGYTLDVVGEGPSSWAQVIPAELSVYPQQEARAIVTFSPPSGTAAPSGTNAFGVRARSTVDPDTSAVAEGDVEIGKVFGLQAKIVPVTSSGRWRGRHVVQLSNWGNAPATLRMVASDPDAALGFYVRPDVVELPLGGTATVRMSVRTRKPFLRGSAVRLPFSVVGERADAGASINPSPIPAMAYADPSRPGRRRGVQPEADPVRRFYRADRSGRGRGGRARRLPGAAAGRRWTDHRRCGSAGQTGAPGRRGHRPGHRPGVLEADDRRRGLTRCSSSRTPGQLTASRRGPRGSAEHRDGPRIAAEHVLLFPAHRRARRTGEPQVGREMRTHRPGRRLPPPRTAGGIRLTGSTGAPSPTGAGWRRRPGPSRPSRVKPAAGVQPAAEPGHAGVAGRRPLRGRQVDRGGRSGRRRAPPAKRESTATAAKLGGVTPPAVILRSRDFPTMMDRSGKPLAAESLLVAVGPFDTPDQAQAVCPQIRAATGEQTCLLFQPQP